MKVMIDPGSCAGHGLCYYTAPELITDDERGFGVVVGDGDVPDARRSAAEQAASLCPERAVHLLAEKAAAE